MKKLLSVLLVALFAAASVQAVAAEGQTRTVEKKEMKRVHKPVRAHGKRSAHRKAARERVVDWGKVAHTRVVHGKAAHRKMVPRPERK